MLKALSSTEKSERDDQARNATPRMPSAVAFARIARAARSSESSDVLGKARCSSRMKNEPEFAWPAVLRTASERKSSGTNESSAKYAIIAARCVPRSAKNLRAIARIKQQYAPPHGCSPGPRRPDRDLVAGRSRRDRRRGGHGARDDDRRRRPRGTLRPGCGDDARGGREPPPDAGAARALAARGGDARGQRLRRSTRERLRPADHRRYDAARSDGRARLLRPEALPALDRDRDARERHAAAHAQEGRRCRVGSSPP